MENTGKETKKKSSGCGCLIFLAIVIAFFMWGAANHRESEQDPALDALVYSQFYVKQQLKAPSTAKFAGINESSVQKVNDNTYIVHSFVDAQNSFGAMIRTKYTATMERVDDKWFTTKIDFK